ncbi:hypothetical protein PG984_010342 [Apiospora sp. TS-2023a]
MASQESLWDIIIHFIWHTVLQPPAPGGPSVPASLLRPRGPVLRWRIAVLRRHLDRRAVCNPAHRAHRADPWRPQRAPRSHGANGVGLAGRSGGGDLGDLLPRQVLYEDTKGVSYILPILYSLSVINIDYRKKERLGKEKKKRDEESQ